MSYSNSWRNDLQVNCKVSWKSDITQIFFKSIYKDSIWYHCLFCAIPLNCEYQQKLFYPSLRSTPYSLSLSLSLSCVYFVFSHIFGRVGWGEMSFKIYRFLYNFYFVVYIWYGMVCCHSLRNTHLASECSFLFLWSQRLCKKDEQK